MKVALALSFLLNVALAAWAWLSYRAVVGLLDALEAYRWLEDELEIGSVDLLVGEEGPCLKVWRN